MNYYKVFAKCGHVKRNKYIVKAFYCKADDGESAAVMTRNISRVKHNQKYAIINVIKIDLDEY